jgi:hypothetical protein
MPQVIVKRWPGQSAPQKMRLAEGIVTDVMKESFAWNALKIRLSW